MFLNRLIIYLHLNPNKHKQEKDQLNVFSEIFQVSVENDNSRYMPLDFAVVPDGRGGITPSLYVFQYASSFLKKTKYIAILADKKGGNWNR